MTALLSLSLSLFFFFFFLVAGVLIDKFADLRKEKQEKEELRVNTCFICGLPRSSFDNSSTTFAQHCNEEHSVWSYLHFIVLLKLVAVPKANEERKKEREGGKEGRKEERKEAAQKVQALLTIAPVTFLGLFPSPFSFRLLRTKDTTEFTGPESCVYAMMNNPAEQVSWFPRLACLSLHQVSQDDEDASGINSLSQRLTRTNQLVDHLSGQLSQLQVLACK